MQITPIAAVAENGVIGTGAGLPWHLPRDVAHFRAYTEGKWLLLGRRTYQEMAGWFRPGHKPVVLTRTAFAEEMGAPCVTSMPQAIALATEAGATDLVVCGGAQCYAAALPWAHRLILTLVHTTVANGARFPEWHNRWKEISRRTYSADHEHAHSFSITEWEPQQTLTS